MTKLKTILLITAASLGLASAQSPAKVTSTTLLVTQVTENGKTVEKFVDAGKGVLPGNILVFRQTLDNLSGKKLTGVRLAMPIPAAVSYQSQQCSVAGVKTLYSLDKDDKNKASAWKYDEPTKLFKKVTVKENGKDVVKEVQATPADYTAVRWQLPDLSAGQSVECSARVKVK